ncbi:hypothetical protein MRX96_045978 [Rhipicephalus microplus]
MDKAEDLWNLKRTRQRYGSNSESPPKNPKRGSDGPVLFTGEGIEEMMRTYFSENTGTLETVKFWPTKPPERAPSPFALSMASGAANPRRYRRSVKRACWDHVHRRKCPPFKLTGNNGGMTPSTKTGLFLSRNRSHLPRLADHRNHAPSPDSPVEECPGTLTLFDGVFKRPLPVSRRPRRLQAQRHATRTKPQSSAAENEHCAQTGAYRERWPEIATKKCTNGTGGLRLTSPEEILPVSAPEGSARLSRMAKLWAFRTPHSSCHSGSSCEGSGLVSSSTSESVLSHGFCECTDAFVECALTSPEVAQSPGAFCRGYRLHEDYKILELGVSGKTLLRGRHLFLFLGQVTQLTELSLFGLYLMHPDDNCRLAALVASNVFLRKLTLKMCHIADR